MASAEASTHGCQKSHGTFRQPCSKADSRSDKCRPSGKSLRALPDAMCFLRPLMSRPFSLWMAPKASDTATTFPPCSWKISEAQAPTLPKPCGEAFHIAQPTATLRTHFLPSCWSCQCAPKAHAAAQRGVEIDRTPMHRPLTAHLADHKQLDRRWKLQPAPEDCPLLYEPGYCSGSPG